MKKVILFSLVFISIKVFCQDTNDSAYIKNLPLQARVISYLVPRTLDPSNDSLYSVFIKWRTSLRANPVNGTTTVTIDTIPTVELVNLYSYVLQQPEGLGVSTLMRSQLISVRAAHPYLDRLCNAIESNYSLQLTNMMTIGRRLLIGK